MMSFETQKMVFDILLSLAESERLLEAGRQMLNETLKDSSYHLFQLLDVENNSISPFNIISFMEKGGSSLSVNEAQMLILFYDANCDGLLSYYEFLNLVQSSTVLLPVSPRSREICGCTVANESNASTLTKLIEIEVVNIRTLLQHLKGIQQQSDFNINELFNEMKQFNSISLESLIAYCDKHKVSISYKDITHVMHRLDFNRDGKIDQAEFIAFFGYQCNECPYVPPKQLFERRNYMDVIRSSSPEERTYSLGHSIQGVNRFNESTLSLRLSPKRLLSPEDNSIMQSGKRDALIEGKAKSRFNRSIEENLFLEYITYLMTIENKIEKDKIDLSHQSDFNILNAFQLFTKSTDFISEDDLKNGLSRLDIIASSSEIKVMMNRFDLRNEGVIPFFSFFDMVTPFESSFRNTLKNRRPRYKPFKLSTKTYYQGLIRIIIASEAKLNTLKAGFTSLKANIKDIFSSIDKSNQGYFTVEEWEDYLKANNALDDKIAAALVFIRLDRSRCGKVSYCNLIDELTTC